MNAAKCPLCPYYRKGEKTLECFIWRGTPKLWRNREGSEAAWVGEYAAFGMAVLTFFPVPWLLREWPLLLIYSFGIGALVLSIALHECARCLNFDCGHCGVPDVLKKEYLTTFG
jgi:hypothetical protein